MTHAHLYYLWVCVGKYLNIAFFILNAQNARFLLAYDADILLKQAK